MHEGPEVRGRSGLVEIGVFQHDLRRLAAELEQNWLELARRFLGDDAPHVGRAREIDAANARIGDERVDDVGGPLARGGKRR